MISERVDNNDLNRKTMNYQKLFDHMFQEHGLTLTEGEMQDIIHEVNSLQSKGKTKEEVKEDLRSAFGYYSGIGEVDISEEDIDDDFGRWYKKYAQSYDNQDGCKTESTPERIYRDVVVCQKVEEILKPEYMNSVFTWLQIKDAILALPPKPQP